MNIAIINAQPNGNKGAEAMLVVVLQRIASKYPDCKLYVESLNDGSDLKALKHTMFKGSFLFRPKLIFFPYRNLPQDIGLVIDIGGINYHDGALKGLLRNFVRHFYFLRHQVPLIFFTQDAGPFTKLVNKLLARYVYSSAIAVFARSPETQSHLSKLGVKNIKGPYPDITIALEVPASSMTTSETLKYDVVVSPSAVMKDKYGSDYIDRTCRVIKQVLDRGMSVVLLPHSTTNNNGMTDASVCIELQEILNSPNCRVDLSEYSAVEIKQILSKPNFVITSRFHAMVGALSQGVPVFVDGWSHKYSEVLKQFCLTESNLAESDYMLPEWVFDSAERENKINKITEKSKLLKAEVTESFEELFDLMEHYFG